MGASGTVGAENDAVFGSDGINLAPATWALDCSI